jgi:hypothetical protein
MLQHSLNVALLHHPSPIQEWRAVFEVGLFCEVTFLNMLLSVCLQDHLATAQEGLRISVIGGFWNLQILCSSFILAIGPAEQKQEMMYTTYFM